MVAKQRNALRIQPASLSWARERSGFDLPTAAHKLNIASDKLAGMEAGEIPLTPSQIRNVSALYGVSAAVLFYSKAPTETFDAPKDFRSLPGGVARALSPKLRKEIDRVRAQIAHLRELAETGTIVSSPPSLSISRDESVELTGELIRQWCENGSPASSATRRDPRGYLTWWINAVEARGVLVTQVSGIPLIEMRGMCIADKDFPTIVLNGADTLRGRTFTLVHELVHVLLGIDGISNGTPSRNDLEVFCNAVAAAGLVPREQLLEDDRVSSADSATSWSLDELGDLAEGLGVSREAMLRRLSTLGKVSRECFEKQQAALQVQYGKKGKQEQGGGPAYDVMLLRNLGRPYVEAVLRARERGVISELTTADYLFAKTQWADKLEERLAHERRA